MPAGLASRAADTPAEIWRKTHRGCRGGSQSRGKRTRSKQQRFMEKRSSVGNKMDEFTALARSQRTFRECNVMCFTGTGLHEDISDQNFSMDGFQTVPADQKRTDSGKRKGVGCLLFWLTTDGAILVILRLRNVFVDRILNFLLLDFGHIPPRFNTGRHGRSFLPVAIELAAPPVEGEETGAPRGNLRGHRENVQTPYRQKWKLNPRCCFPAGQKLLIVFYGQTFSDMQIEDSLYSASACLGLRAPSPEPEFMKWSPLHW
ncbi:uncharacterized protein [Mobula birostris]|uniref:uncharacterized protein n=1 Tax=Mobula birostris TaxID=1983395 RepID=UPI003B27BD74